MPTSRCHGGTALTSRPAISTCPDWLRLNPAISLGWYRLPSPEDDQGEELAGRDGKRDVAQHLCLAEAKRDIPEFDGDGHHDFSPGTSRGEREATMR